MCKAPLGNAESCETEEVGTNERDGSGARQGVPGEDAARKDRGHGLRSFSGGGGDITSVCGGSAR